MCTEKRRGTPKETLKNLRQPMALGRKMQLFLRNNLMKIRAGSTCCGHYGEPGC